MTADTPDITRINPHSRRFRESADLLKKKFVHNQGMPLCLSCNSSRCFTATTATTLLALHHIGHLTDEMRVQFHETIFACKNSPDGTSSSSQQIAWDQSEGFSPWTTSLAIWALLGTKYNGSLLLEIKEAALWLIEQRQTNNMWGRIPHDTTNLLTTSLTLHALKLVSDMSNAIGLTDPETEKVKKARKGALVAIRELALYHRDTIYWTGPTESGIQPDPTATLCAIWALHTSKDLDKDKTEEDTRLVEGGIRYLRKTLREQAQPGKPPIWSFRKVISPPTVGPAWNLVSFTPSFIIPLLAMQCDPFDEICFAPMKWLQTTYLEDEHGWSHENYGHDTTHALSYTTAYALWALAIWYKHATKRCIRQHEVYKKEKSRGNFAWTLLIIVSICLLFNFVTRFLPPIPIKALADWESNTYNGMVFLSVVSGLFPLIGLLNFIDRRFFKERLRRLFDKSLNRTKIPW